MAYCNQGGVCHDPIERTGPSAADGAGPAGRQRALLPHRRPFSGALGADHRRGHRHRPGRQPDGRPAGVGGAAGRQRGDAGGGIIGFDKNDKLILKKMTVDEAYSRGIRDAVEWGPFLIVNGVNYYKNVNYYTWTCGRTAIGQRADGIVLMLVIDGLQSHSKGASYADMAHIMELYGAVNAANLDGGTSTAMTVNHEYINSPWNGYVSTYRWLPNAWIVVNK